MKSSLRFILILGVLFLSTTRPASAHIQSTAYLNLRTSATGTVGEWQVSLRDLEDAVGLDSDDDGVLTWGELLNRKEAVVAYLFSRLHVQADGQPVVLQVEDYLVDDHSDGAYAVLRFGLAGCANPTKIELNYQALFDLDPKHRGLFRLEHSGSTSLAVFTPEMTTQIFDLESRRPTTSFATFVREGVSHIWSGYDHILFLLALLLPGVLWRNGTRWEPVSGAKSAFINVTKIVTSFTAAHSITLSLAALGYVHLPSRLIESTIAASVIVAATNNLVPFFSERGWMVAFGFGLLHGFGFANALTDLGLQPGQFAMTLFGFNLGVELGQLAIVLVFLPLALTLRHLLAYQRLCLRAGSVAILLISSTWFAERVGDFKWLPF